MCKPLMSASIIIVFYVFRNSTPQRTYSGLWIQVHILAFYGTPKSLNPDIIQTSCSSVHANAHSILNTGIMPFLTSILHALI